MPTDPPSRWQFPDLADPDLDARTDDLIAVGADLEPGTLLEAYRSGLFPMPEGRGSRRLGWWSPVERGVLPLDGLRVSRSLRQASKHVEIRVDTAFADVVHACADPRRTGSWIDARIEAAYARLHELGRAHSVETWRDGELVGGLYGVSIGGLFAGESMFHRVRDASKVVLVALVEILRDEHAGSRLLDVQWRTDHLASLGVVEIPRADYLRRLAVALELPEPAGLRVTPGR
ncbi:leucyl/phenylalanyl-tRNA--protein transferase [Marmoricola endophyticus]|uniref:Leucyl/phenylalanyl-tRNA--protein transferase n=1 Tax=Marmoricola endophyticus TaxID=2040280 RepID=A0A917BJI0_9ACTN|nr:leucyl/phenylalanyl-tRNA--protein transferase [Marmoricola endophyticus]GGF47741.1 leucyl/phenylalanyl-tRNA--protein transferase [Marmoricola endophyticus]